MRVLYMHWEVAWVIDKQLQVISNITVIQVKPKPKNKAIFKFKQ